MPARPRQALRGTAEESSGRQGPRARVGQRTRCHKQGSHGSFEPAGRIRQVGVVHRRSAGGASTARALRQRRQAVGAGCQASGPDARPAPSGTVSRDRCGGRSSPGPGAAGPRTQAAARGVADRDAGERDAGREARSSAAVASGPGAAGPGRSGGPGRQARIPSGPGSRPQARRTAAGGCRVPARARSVGSAAAPGRPCRPEARPADPARRQQPVQLGA